MDGSPTDISIPVGMKLHSGRVHVDTLVPHLRTKIAELRDANPDHGDAPIRIRIESTFGMMAGFTGDVASVNAGIGLFAPKLKVRSALRRALCRPLSK
jgi:hypothetical protein